MLTKQQTQEGVNYAKKNFLEDERSHLWVDKHIINQRLNLNKKHILDFGCGMGGMSLWYAKNWNCHVDAIDIDSHHLQIANILKEQYQVENVNFTEQNILSQELNSTYDIIFLNDVVEHLPDSQLEVIFNKLFTLLDTNGTIYISYPPWQGPYASHINRVLKIPWCQFLPDPYLHSFLKKHNQEVIGKLESNLLEIYKGLNKMTHPKLFNLLRKSGFKITYRYSHSWFSKRDLKPKKYISTYPFSFLITKEVIFASRDR